MSQISETHQIDEQPAAVSDEKSIDASWQSDCESCPYPEKRNEGKPIISLRHLKIGQKAQVVCVRAGGELGRRIRDMGLIPGAELEIVGRAPLRDPVAVRLPGFTLSLRNKEADFISVTLLS